MAELSPGSVFRVPQPLHIAIHESVRKVTRVCTQRSGVPMSATMSYNIQREAAETKEFGIFIYLASDAAYTT